EREPAAVRTQRWCESDVPPPATGEQVDRRCQERQQTGDEDQLDRPAADEARAEVEVGGCPLRELEALVQGPERVLRCAADLSELVCTQPVSRVADRIGRVVA